MFQLAELLPKPVRYHSPQSALVTPKATKPSLQSSVYRLLPFFIDLYHALPKERQKSLETSS